MSKINNITGFTKTPKAQAIHEKITRQEEAVKGYKKLLKENGPKSLDKLNEAIEAANLMKAMVPNKAYTHAAENYMRPLENIQNQRGKVADSKLEQRLNTIITKDLPHRSLPFYEIIAQAK